jgi:putative Holliday junction resolvase
LTGAKDDDVVVLTDEDGEEHEFTVVDVIEVDGNDYAVLLPMGQEHGEGEEEEAVILRVESDDEGEDILVEIEDDDEWERVAEAWEEIAEDEQ